MFNMIFVIISHFKEAATYATPHTPCFLPMTRDLNTK